MAPILSSVPIVRVQFIRTVNNKTVAPNQVTATPTVPYLTVAGQHGFIDPLQQETSQVDSANVGYLDLIATDDTDVTEAFGWTIAFAGSTRPTRTVSVPQSGGAVRTITTDDGVTMPAIWLSDLADFSGASGPTGSTLATQSYVTGAIGALQATSDPFPQYAVDAQAVPAGGTTGQVLSKTGNADYAIGWAAGGSGGSSFTQTTTRTANYTAADNQIVPVNTSGGSFTVTGPSSGKPFGVRWIGGTAGPVVAAPTGYTINGAASITLSLPPSSTAGELVTWQAVGTDYQAFGGFKPQTALDQRLAPLVAMNPAAKLPPLFTGQQIHTGFASGHGFTVTQGATGSDNLNDTSDAALGSQCVTLVTDGAGTVKRLEKTTGINIDMTERCPVIWLKVESTTARLGAIELWLGSGSFGVSYRFSPWNSVNTDGRIETIQAGKWIRLAFPWQNQALIATYGTPNRAAITAIRVAVQDDGAAPVTVRLGGIGSMPEPRQVWPNGVVSFTFDDSYDNVATVAKPKMDQYGFPGTVYNICSVVGTAGYMTLAQLKDLQNKSGWHIAAHAYDIGVHNTPGGFPAVDPTVLADDFRKNRQWLLENGFQNSEHLAFPQGYFNDAVLALCDRYFTTSRTTVSRTQETWPPSEPQKLRVRNLTSTTTLNQFQGWVDDAYTNGFWLILVGHSTDDSARAGGNSVGTALFAQMVDYVASKGIAVATVADVAAGRRLPRGTAAALAPGKPDDLYLDGGQAVTAGLETYNRLHATSGIPLTSGRLQLTAFTPSRTRTISALAFASGGTAGSTITLARAGLYLVNADGSFTLVAATASDTTVGATASSWYSRTLDTGGGLPASYTLQRGQRHVFGILVTATTMPNVVGVVPAQATLGTLSPAIGFALNSQTDLPTSIGAGSLSGTNNMPYGYAA